jgi:parallel beta-helix repeat protein
MKKRALVLSLIVVLAFSSIDSLKALELVKANPYCLPSLPAPIYIKNDGSIDPSTVPIQRDGDTYTLTGNVNNTIVVQRGNIIFDGNNFTITKPSVDTTGFMIGIGLIPAINVTHSNNVIIKNTVFSGCLTGITLENSKNIHIAKNIMTNCDYGIVVSSCSNSNITENKITSCSSEGIFILGNCDHITIQCNELGGNHYGFWSVGSTFSQSYIIGNDIMENEMGLYFCGFDNYIIGNTFEDNIKGIWFISSGNNAIYRNNFVNNVQNLFSASMTNQSTILDVGAQGNYWSDYNNKIPNATEIGNSGIWNTHM